MAQSPVVYNLKDRYARLSGEIAEVKKQLTMLRAKRYIVERALRLIDDGVRPEEIKGIRPQKRIPGLNLGDISRIAVATMRRAQEPLSANAIAAAIAAERGIDVSPKLIQRTREQLWQLVASGRVVRSGKHRARLWSLAAR